MRWEFRGYGTRDEIEQILKSAYEAQGRSPRRQAEAEEAGRAFLRGASEVTLGHTVYVIEDSVTIDDLHRLEDKLSDPRE